MVITASLRKNYLVYLVISLAILYPLLKKGYVLSFDMRWGMVWPDTATSNNAWLFMEALQSLFSVVSSDVTQKILLMGIFLLAGIGAHRLSMRFAVVRMQPVSAYLAGIFYMINPFVYTRLMAGQWLVLLGYALLPWIVSSLYAFMKAPSFMQTIRTLLWLIAVGLTSVHVIGIVIALGILLFAFVKGASFKDKLRYGLLIVAGWLIINSMWLIPFLHAKDQGLERVSSFGASHLSAFMTSASVADSALLSVLTLQGFWADMQGRYVLPSSLGLWFYGLGFVMLLLVLVGLVQVIRNKHRLGMVLVLGSVVAVWLGLGVATSWTSGTTQWLMEHVPLYRGYREPQKWLMILCLAYACLGAYGFATVLQRIQKKQMIVRQGIVGAVLLLPLLITPMLLWGAGGQLRASEYPKDYAQAKKVLDREGKDYSVLVLPWHMYLPVSYTGRVVANPAPYYFEQHMITGNDPELAGVPLRNTDALYRRLNNELLPQRNERTDIAGQLASYNVRYVLLLKEADWHRYGWLQRQTNLTTVQDSETLRLYRIDSKGKVE